MLTNIKKPLSCAFLVVLVFLLTNCSQNFGVFKNEKSTSTEVGKEAITGMFFDEKPYMYCKLGRGSAKFGRKWENFYHANFALEQEGRTNIKLVNKKTEEDLVIQVMFNNSGQKIIFCPVTGAKSSHKKRVSCRSIYFLEEDLRYGVKRTFDMTNLVRGSQVTCAYDHKKLKPLYSAK